MFWWVAVFSDLCGVCVVVGVFFKVEECGSAMVFLVADVSFSPLQFHCSVLVLGWKLELEYDVTELLLYF
jgi:hypothetical protein